jgi:hypothetical protein
MISTSHALNTSGYPYLERNGRLSSIARHILYHRCGYDLLPKIICHTCDNRACINPDHIILGTHTDNNRNMVERERQARGEQIGTAKLTASDVLAIRALRSKSASLVEIGELFGVVQTTACEITRR